MYMLKNRKLKIALAFFALFICLSQIQQTYAKYLDTKSGDTDFNIAKWKITVNNKDITEASTMSSLITPVYTENENVAKDVIAPGSEGYFDLDIDASETEVSFKYTITATSSENSAVTDLKITGYSLNNNSKIEVDGTSEISNQVNYNDENKSLTLRVYFKWLDGTGEKMDNEKDTEASTSGSKAKLKVSMSFVQVA